MATNRTDPLFQDWNWQPPEDWLRVSSIDTHTGGEPLRIITSGLPPIEGRTVLEKRRFFMKHYDHLRRGLLREPRGHADMYGAILSKPADDADLDVFFINTEGYSPMCGHAVLAIAKVAIETGLVSKPGRSPELVLNVPAGVNRAKTVIENGRVTDITFRNVPSFVYLADQTLDVPEVGSVRFDIAFGGAFYAIVEADSLGLDLTPAGYRSLVDNGRRIKAAIKQNIGIEHPFEADLSPLFGVIFTGKPLDSRHHSRNVNVFEDGEVDRCPTGTGVSARSALHVARGDLALGETITVESILGSTMTVKAVEKATFGPYDAVVPEVGGTASIMGRSELLFDPADPFPDGFIFR